MNKVCLFVILLLGLSFHLNAGWNLFQIDNGSNPAISVEPLGAAHICYTQNDRAMYANNRYGSWNKEMVQADAYAADILVFADTVHYCYFQVNSTYDTTTLYYTKRHVAEITWSTPEIVDQINADVWEVGPVTLAMSQPGRLHLLYLDNAWNANMFYCSRKDTGWAKENIGSAYNYASLAIDSRDMAHVIYYNPSGLGGLYYMTNAPDSVWSSPEFVDQVGGQLEGLDCDIDVDTRDSVHVIYVSGPDEDYMYATKNGGWDFYLLAYGSFSNAGMAIAVDKVDIPHMVYYDQQLGSLRYAYVQDTTVYEETVAGSGFFNDIAVDSTIIPHVVYQDDHDQIIYAQRWPSDINESDDLVPDHFILLQNYPNPFNAQTRIQYFLPQTQEMELKIFDVQGNLVKILEKGLKEKGWHSVLWDGTDDYHKAVPSSVYFYSLNSPQFHAVKKLILIR